MTILHEEPLGEHSPEPLHQLLWSFGKQWLPRTGSKAKTPRFKVRDIRMDHTFDLGESLLTERSQEIAATQLATSLRLQGLEDEDAAMLGLLESLVLAGEISFRDYVARVQNLFPRVLEQIDMSLRLRITSLMVG